MDTSLTLLSIVAIWTVAAVTPGPNFFVTVQTAAAHSRRLGIMTVAGVVSGTLIWGLAGFFGISALFAAAPWFYGALKLLGGLYLVYLGIRLILASFRPMPSSPALSLQPALSAVAAWRRGLLTNLANPKTAAFVASLFATTMPADPSLALGLAAVGAMGVISLLWYGGVAWIFASRAMAQAYRRASKMIDRLAGGIFVVFGVKLALGR